MNRMAPARSWSVHLVSLTTLPRPTNDGRAVTSSSPSAEQPARAYSRPARRSRRRDPRYPEFVHRADVRASRATSGPDRPAASRRPCVGQGPFPLAEPSPENDKSTTAAHRTVPLLAFDAFAGHSKALRPTCNTIPTRPETLREPELPFRRNSHGYICRTKPSGAFQALAARAAVRRMGPDPLLLRERSLSTTSAGATRAVGHAPDCSTT